VVRGLTKDDMDYTIEAISNVGRRTGLL
jgi:hypothetical protein